MATDIETFQNFNIFISSPNLLCDHSLESSLRDDSNKWSHYRFGEEIKELCREMSDSLPLKSE